MIIFRKNCSDRNNFRLLTALQQTLLKMRRTNKQIANEEEFAGKRSKLFDISHVNINDFAKYRISLVFLENQNMHRTMAIDDLGGAEECFRSSKPKRLKKATMKILKCI
jgi:hypothetical protein